MDLRLTDLEVEVPVVNRVSSWGPREVKALRHALNLTIDGFADKLGVSRRAVVYWEGAGRPNESNHRRKQPPKGPSRESAILLDKLLEQSDYGVRQRFFAELKALPWDDSWRLRLVETITGRIDPKTDPDDAALARKLARVIQSSWSGGPSRSQLSVVLIAGHASSGKASLGRFFAAATGWVFLEHGHAYSVDLPELERPRQPGPGYEALLQAIEHHLKNGVSVIACVSPACELTHSARPQLQAMLETYGASGHVIWV